ncbi:MAG: hypothetical protein JSS28_03820, partial [Proteobacteria bacterium]|nr:hypothetical protein [Pseudomonadota bacterium]
MYAKTTSRFGRATWLKVLGISAIRSLLASIGLLCSGMAAVHAAIPASERQVLLNLYAYTDGIDWDPQYQGGWNGPAGTECTWYGITCDAQGATVIG